MAFSLNPSPGDGQVLVTGSIAFDQIMDFDGDFKDHVLPDKIHTINLSFLVQEFRKQRGGCAANIAYSLSLLGQRPRIVASAGGDFDSYSEWLTGHGIDISGIQVFPEEVTACCFITTDRADNQITGFHPGAMARARELSVREALAGGGPLPRLAIVAPDDPEAMIRHCREVRELGIPLAYDPSFQVIAMDGETLKETARGARVVFVNDYEFAVFQEKTGVAGAALFELAQMWVVTLGEKGSEVLLSPTEKVPVPAARARQVVDPTGAGDAYRSGFLAGLVQGRDLGVCGRMGSVAAVYAIESYGTQSHRYTREEFERRYQESFGGGL
jgi:adenosine kinase